MRLRILSLVTLAIVLLLSPTTSSACYICAEEGLSDDVCQPTTNWWQTNGGFENCEVKERCFLGLVCYTFCKLSNPCIDTVAMTNASGQQEVACTSQGERFLIPA